MQHSTCILLRQTKKPDPSRGVGQNVTHPTHRDSQTRGGAVQNRHGNVPVHTQPASHLCFVADRSRAHEGVLAVACMPLLRRRGGVEWGGLLRREAGRERYRESGARSSSPIQQNRVVKTNRFAKKNHFTGAGELPEPHQSPQHPLLQDILRGGAIYNRRQRCCSNTTRCVNTGLCETQPEPSPPQI